MITGRVIGVVVATCKDEQLVGRKLLVVEPTRADGSSAGKPAIAVDCIGAGAGEVVMMARSRDAALAAAGAPVDLAIIGIVDSMHRPPDVPRDLSAFGFQTGKGGGRNDACPSNGATSGDRKAGRL